MTYIISGSHALCHNVPSLSKHPKDLDVIVPIGHDRPTIAYDGRVEYHELPDTIISKFTTVNQYLDLPSLYTLKLSHAEYDIHWYKTVNDIQFIKKQLGVVEHHELGDYYNNLLDSLKDHWKTLHTYKNRINLMKDKEQFFTDKVNRIMDHDTIHKHVAYGERPMYTKILMDGHQVMVDKSKFDGLCYGDKISLAKEETTVIAIERWIIPNRNFCGYTRLYRDCSKHLITQMTKGWFPTFMADNFANVGVPDTHCMNKMREFTANIS
jgi:hypothetical protein